MYFILKKIIMKETHNFSFEVYESINELNAEDTALLTQARQIAEQAYAPYSNFFVGAAALMDNGATVTGTNQENASYPVTLCAERALMATAASIHPNIGIQTMAISYHNHNANTNSHQPLSPCGMCRQSLLEFETRYHSIRLILSGLSGKVYIIQQANQLLPLSFKGDNLK